MIVACARAAFAVGTLHGLAGSAHLLGMLPALALLSVFAAGAHLLLFGTGSIAVMGAFGSLVGWIADRPSASGLRVRRATLSPEHFDQIFSAHGTS